MNVGRAITVACREQRAKDMRRLASSYHHRYYNVVMAYWMWGWDIHGPGGLGRPGSDL